MSMPVQKPHRSKQNYATPEVFIAAVKRRLGIAEFGFDFAAEPHTTQSPDGFYSLERSALAEGETWSVQLDEGEWGWLNPPYTDIAQWAARCAELRRAGGQIAFLVPASVGANWFRDYVHGHALVLALNGRLAFMPDKPTWLYPKDCVLCLYSPTIVPGFEVWNWRQQP